MDEITNIDLYELFGVISSASTEEIKKAYRKKALLCHPDKNPDNPQAAESFHQLSKALEILTDESARLAYDKVLNARINAKLRIRQFDAERKRFKEDLERREELHANQKKNTDEAKLKAEIERLQKEGKKLLEDEQAKVRKLISDELQGTKVQDTLDPKYCRVKIKWKVTKDDQNNGGYTYDNLYRILYKHGDIDTLVVSTTKKGRALVEYKEKAAAESAVQLEIGLLSNPLKLQGLWNTKK